MFSPISDFDDGFRKGSQTGRRTGFFDELLRSEDYQRGRESGARDYDRAERQREQDEELYRAREEAEDRRAQAREEAEDRRAQEHMEAEKERELEREADERFEREIRDDEITQLRGKIRELENLVRLNANQASSTAVDTAQHAHLNQLSQHFDSNVLRAVAGNPGISRKR